MAREVEVLDTEENARIRVEVPNPGTIRVQTPVRPSVSAATALAKGDPGASAYEIAVQNGFVGTEAEWLDYLMNYATGETSELLDQHVQDPEPHPAYDNIPSLKLIFENGLI